jgi:hypothetical protein
MIPWIWLKWSLDLTEMIPWIWLKWSLGFDWNDPLDLTEMIPWIWLKWSLGFDLMIPWPLNHLYLGRLRLPHRRYLGRLLGRSLHVVMYWMSTENAWRVWDGDNGFVYVVYFGFEILSGNFATYFMLICLICMYIYVCVRMFNMYI